MLRRFAILLPLSVCLLLSNYVRAGVITWNAGGATNYWTEAQNWESNAVPGTGDTAMFDLKNIAQVVTVAGVQSILRMDVTGQTSYTFLGLDVAALIVETALNYSSSSSSTMALELSGPAALTVDSGQLTLSSRLNSFSGGININGGSLIACACSGSSAFGSASQTINIGASGGTPADATMGFYGVVTEALPDMIFAHPVVVRGGNAGKAIVMLAVNCGGSTILSGGIELQKDLTLLNESLSAGSSQSRVLQISGNISGSGAIAKQGPGHVVLSGSNSFNGVVVIRDGYLTINGGMQTFTASGGIQVAGGALIVNSDAMLGSAGNNIALGSEGRLGGLNAGILTSRGIELAGNGGMIFGTGVYAYNGTISGSGMLLLAGTTSVGMIGGANTYSGGTRLVWGKTTASSDVAALGTGEVTVAGSAILLLSHASNIASDKSVRILGVVSDNFENVLFPVLNIPAGMAAVPTISADSWGILGLRGGDTFNAVNALLAGGFGNGYMFIQASESDATITADPGAGLAIGAENTYRFGAKRKLTLDSASTAGVLNDRGPAANVQIGTSTFDISSNGVGGIVYSCDDQTYTGTTRIIRSSFIGMALAGAGQSPIGGSGPVELIAGALQLDGFAGGQAVTKGSITFNGHCRLVVNKTGLDCPTSLTVGSLVRSHRSVLYINGLSNDLGGNERIFAGGVSSSNGMAAINGRAAPYLLGLVSNDTFDVDFLNYGINGFHKATYSTDYLSAGASSILKLSADLDVASDKEVFALKTNSRLSTSAGKTITLGSGGLVLTGAGKVHSASISSGSSELLVYVGRNAANTIEGSVSTSGGMTKTGPGILVLKGDNSSTLIGNITVDQGSLEFSSDNNLGHSSNMIVLNNYEGTWSEGLRVLISVQTTLNRHIVMGANGGAIYTSDSNLILAGPLTGAGPLQIRAAGSVTLTNPHSYLPGGFAVRSHVILGSGCRLGTGPAAAGPIYVGMALTVEDDSAAAFNRIILGEHGNNGGGSILFTTTAPMVGSLEGGTFGTGHVGLTSKFPSVLTVGLNNLSTDFYGQIQQSVDGMNSAVGAGLTKVGSGTLTLWGQHSYTGPTTVKDGRLDNNNLISGPVNVTSVEGSTPVYGGNGTTRGLVTLNGGALAGGGVYEGGIILNSGTVSGTHNIKGPVALNGGTFGGSHAISGDVVAGSTVIAPGNGIGTIDVSGDLTFAGSTVLSFELGGPGLNDVINVGGNLAISDATINFSAAVGYEWIAGTYTLFTCGTRSGEFILGSSPGGGLNYAMDYSTLGTISLAVTASATRGDFDGSGVVDIFDIEMLIRNFTARASYDPVYNLIGSDPFVDVADLTELVTKIIGVKMGDPNLDGRVDFLDFQQLLDNWMNADLSWQSGDFTGDLVVDFNDFQVLLNNWNPSGLEGAVPEPATFVLLAFGALTIQADSRRSGSRKKLQP